MTTNIPIQTQPMATPPRRIMLISVSKPITKSLTDLLNMPSQPITTPPETLSIFRNLYETARQQDVLTSPTKSWDHRKAQRIAAAAREDLARAEALSTAANMQGTTLLTRIEPYWITHPQSALDQLPVPGTIALLRGPFSLHPPKEYLTAHSTLALSFASSVTLDHESDTNINIPDDTHNDNELNALSTFETHHDFTFADTNQTILPDEYLRTWQPVFVIAHPALSFASIYHDLCEQSKRQKIRDTDVRPLFRLRATYKHLRALYEFTLQQSSLGLMPKPIIIDQKNLHNTIETGLLTRFCAVVGLNPDVIQVAKIWTQEINIAVKRVANPDAVHMVVGWFMGQGKSLTEAVVLARKKTWSNGFGGGRAREIEMCVWAAVADYEFLAARAMV